MTEQTSQPIANAAGAMISPHILAKLKQHPSHHPDVTCMECGYKGAMGIKNNGAKPFMSAFWALIITLWAGWFGALGIVMSPAIFGAAWVIIMRFSAKPVVTCPNCDKDLNI